MEPTLCSDSIPNWVGADQDDPTEQEQFDRISGILSQLIQEANDAIQSTSSTLSNPNAPNDSYDTRDEDDNNGNNNNNNNNTHPLTISTSRRGSRLPRPKRLSLDSIYRHRSSSLLSLSSSTSTSSIIINDQDEYDDTLFSPISSNLTTPMSRTISPFLFDKLEYIDESSSSPMDQQDDMILLPHHDSLMDSFERLDSSLAIVDYLSRDLATHRRHTTNECIIPLDDDDDTLDSDRQRYVWCLIVLVLLVYILHSTSLLDTLGIFHFDYWFAIIRS